MQVNTEARHPIKMWTDGVYVESEAIEQAKKTASLPFIFRHVALMPDVHKGIGATVGSVVPTVGAIVPSCVGVDIGCGMCWTRTTLTADQLPKDLRPLREAIERAVPHGRTDDGGDEDEGSWQDVPHEVANTWTNRLADEYDAMVKRCRETAHRRPVQQLGTLGTGNHFIEVVVDDENQVGLMLHSGSRGPGARIGAVYTGIAKRECKRWFVDLPDPDLAFLPDHTEPFEQYWHAMQWAQRYAVENRRLMRHFAFEAMLAALPPFEILDTVDCHHNYATIERHFGHDVIVTRKGAVRAGLGDLGIIPGSMGARSFIVRGKGNREAFESCSHGAGRAMSRNDAKRRFTVDDHAKATAGIECRKDADVVDETPAAYKSIDSVMLAQSDLVEVVRTLRQVVCVKG